MLNASICEDAFESKSVVANVGFTFRWKNMMRICEDAFESKSMVANVGFTFRWKNMMRTYLSWRMEFTLMELYHMVEHYHKWNEVHVNGTPAQLQSISSRWGRLWNHAFKVDEEKVGFKEGLLPKHSVLMPYILSTIQYN
jgi:hypothetical protein